MELSPDQKKALSTLLDWVQTNKKGYVTLGGYAGTGKTTLIGILRQKLEHINPKLKVAFCSFTGKAARVLKSKLKENKSIYKQDIVGTIHSLIYSPIVNNKEEIIGWKRKEELEMDLIIVDEASMVDSSIWKDLEAYKKPIIAIGDHGQLPPINGNFNLMEKPMLILSQIHRQARDNPIINVSILAREKGIIPFGNYGMGVRKMNRSEAETGIEVEEMLRSYRKDTLILCGYNHTRIKLNEFIRNSLELNPLGPEPRDRVICLRNNHQKEIYNGMLGTLVSIEQKNEDWFNVEIKMDDQEENYSGSISVRQFNNRESLNFTKQRSKIMEGDLFDYGYALTVHKAQGSQAKKVILFEERFAKMDDDMWRRWLYTAVTRAEEELYIIGY